MPNVFSGNSGRISVVDSVDGVIPLGVTIGDLRNELGFKGLLTSVSFLGQSSVQVMHTLDQFYYFYVFGERASNVTITGLAFVADCFDTNNDGYPNGLLRAFDWYERNRVSNSGRTIALTLSPGLVVNAILTAFSYEVVDPSINIGAFSMQFIYLPRKALTTAIYYRNMTGALASSSQQLLNLAL